MSGSNRAMDSSERSMQRTVQDCSDRPSPRSTDATQCRPHGSVITATGAIVLVSPESFATRFAINALLSVGLAFAKAQGAEPEVPMKSNGLQPYGGSR